MRDALCMMTRDNPTEVLGPKNEGPMKHLEGVGGHLQDPGPINFNPWSKGTTKESEQTYKVQLPSRSLSLRGSDAGHTKRQANIRWA